MAIYICTHFDNIVQQAMEQKLLGRYSLFAESTHLKASANINSHDFQYLEVTPSTYINS